MSTYAALYMDEDISTLLSTLLRSRGFDVTTVPEQNAIGKTDVEQLALAVNFKRCLVTHNRVDFERLNIQYIAEQKHHYGIIVVPQKNVYELAQRVSVLVNSLTVQEIEGQLFYG